MKYLICSDTDDNFLTAKEFFDYYGKMIFESADYFYYYFDEVDMQWEYINYKTVAEAHNMTMSKDKLAEGIAKFSATLTCVACT